MATNTKENPKDYPESLLGYIFRTTVENLREDLLSRDNILGYIVENIKSSFNPKPENKMIKDASYDDYFGHTKESSKIKQGKEAAKMIKNASYDDYFGHTKEHFNQIETAKKAGYVQGVCECVAAVGEDRNLGKKLLSEMSVTKDMAKKFANPETYKALEQGIFAPPQKIEQTQSIKR